MSIDILRVMLVLRAQSWTVFRRRDRASASCGTFRSLEMVPGGVRPRANLGR